MRLNDGKLFKMSRFLCLILVLFLAACGEETAIEGAVDGAETVDPPAPQLRLIESSYNDLPGWGADMYHEIVPAMRRSCARILRNDPQRPFGVIDQAGQFEDWQHVCRLMPEAGSVADNDTVRQFFENHFTPFQILSGDEPMGLFTGYYEASLNGSLTPSQRYHVPLHKRPDDLVMVDLGQFRDHLKGERIAGRVVNGALRPYEPRADIIAGNWPHTDDEHVLVWVDDPVDAFFLQIQGSGRVLLEDGTTMRVGYAGQNGHPYYAIGRELIAREVLTKETVSMQSIRAWLEDNPQQAAEIMNTNRSYVFFEELKGDGPLGGENVALTATRSLAIDRSLLPYGMPFWVDIAPPMEGAQPLQRLMMGQDTGGAIRGAVRGDVYWGYGAVAETLAGHMKAQGRYWVLLPRSARVAQESPAGLHP